MNEAAESLKKYIKGYYIELDLAIMFKKSQSEIDKILDRINEVKKMIDELEKTGK